MKATAFLFFALTLSLPATATGYGYPDAMGLGSQLSGTDAVTHGFGAGSSVGVGGMDLFGNPAELAGTGSRLMLSGGVNILKQTVNDGLGKHTLTFAGLGPTSFQAGFSSEAGNLALGIARIRDYTYKGEYFFIESSPEPMIAGYENLTVKGGVWEAAMGGARQIAGIVKLGATAGYRLGSVDYEYYWHHFNENIEDSSSSLSREEGEFAWRAGASFELGQSATVGISYASESENCPSFISAGVRFGNLASWNPGVGVEARIFDTGENKAWSGTVFGGIYPENSVFFRGGVMLSSRGGTETDAALGLFLGTTVNFRGMDLDAAFNFGNEGRKSDVFGFPEADTINDIVTGFSVGVSVPL